MLYLLLAAIRNWLMDIGVYPVFGVLDQIEFRALAAAGLAFALVVALGRPTIRQLTKLNGWAILARRTRRRCVGTRRASVTCRRWAGS
ncbi:MAG: hypothetical protein R3B49_07920 [Phycisphaerales bacterium]